MEKKYIVTKEIPVANAWEVGANIGDILTVQRWGSIADRVPTLMKGDKAVCDEDSEYGLEHCRLIEEQFVTLVRERHWEDAIWTDNFIVRDSSNPEQNFRDAVKEYLLTEDGIKQIKWTNNDFNWGDAMNDVPDEIWSKHNIKPIYKGDTVVYSNPIEIKVDQDEVLIPQEYYDGGKA